MRATFLAMSTLAEIEAAADSLPSEQKEELLRFLAVRLHRERALPALRCHRPPECETVACEGDLPHFLVRE